MTQFRPSRKYPNVPGISDDLPSHSAALRAIAEALQIHERRTSDLLSSFVRVGELVDLGLISLDANALGAAQGVLTSADLTEIADVGDLSTALEGDFLRFRSDLWVNDGLDTSDITVGMVTQHQAALSIAWSQLTSPVTVTAGTGLTGGGSLASNITLNVGAGTGISVGGSVVNLADMAQATVKGRAAGAGTGAPTDLSAAQLATIVGSSIDHGALADLLADDHTQYGLLAGRSGGQTLVGGTAASNNLVLRSTSNATKGQVYVDETTAATSVSTGALRVGGGVGVAGRVWAAGLTTTSSILANVTQLRNIGSPTVRFNSAYIARLKAFFDETGGTTTTDFSDESVYMVQSNGTGTGKEVTVNNGVSIPCMAFGSVFDDVGGVAGLYSTGNSSLIIGGASVFSTDPSNSATVTSSFENTIAMGTAYVGGSASITSSTAALLSSGFSSFLFGVAGTTTAGTLQTNAVSATGDAAFVVGAAQTVAASTSATLLGSGVASFVQGKVVRGVLEATNIAAAAFGYVAGTTNTAAVRASGIGSKALGVTTGSGSVEASGTASLAVGGTSSSGNVTASGTGSVALGFTSSASSIIANTTNAIQIGLGTNATASSVQLGATFRFDYAAATPLLNFLTGGNIVTDTSTGTKIGTSITQKLGFFNATTIAQPASAAQAAVATTAATNVAPYGYTTAAQADGIITLLNEIRTVLVNLGLMKGAA